MFNKQYRFKAGDVVKQKVTGFKVILLRNNWRIDQAQSGEWQGKVWAKTGENEGYWREEDLFESELE